jgi:hypothetical protein
VNFFERNLDRDLKVVLTNYSEEMGFGNLD